MTNSELLREIIKKSGLKKAVIAKKMGITPYSLQKKIDNITDFKSNEIIVICDLLKITNLEEKERIFLWPK